MLLTIAALTLHRTTVVAAALTWLVYAVPHTVWHLFNLEPYGTADAIVNSVALAGQVAGGVLVLRARDADAHRGRATATAGVDGARISPVSDGDAGLLARATYAYAKREFGVVPEPTRVYAHHPGILAGYGALEYATEKADRVPGKPQGPGRDQGGRARRVRVLHGHRLDDLDARTA